MNQTIPSVEERQVQPGSEADALLSLESLAKRKIEKIEKLKKELRDVREMYNDTFNNNPKYRDHSEKVKEATREKNAIKKELLRKPDVAKLGQKITDLKFDLNETTKTLSDVLSDYKKQTSATQLELFNGEVMQIVEIVKVIKAPKAYKKKLFKPKR